jgi:hypothetical protein
MGPAAAKAVSIHVDKMNPAMRLYLRTGFLQGRQSIYGLIRRTKGLAGAPLPDRGDER